MLAMLPKDMQCIGSAAEVATSMAKRIRCRRGAGVRVAMLRRPFP